MDVLLGRLTGRMDTILAIIVNSHKSSIIFCNKIWELDLYLLISMKQIYYLRQLKKIS
jgi:hypothetical protein